MSTTLSKLTGNLPEILARIGAYEETASLLAGAEDTREALRRLENAGLLMEAARLVAHALPKREAVWWACMCAVHTAPAEAPLQDRLTREAAEEWVRKQTDAQRRIAMELAMKTGLTTPEAWAAVAAFWSGDSMAPPGQDPVPPAPHLAGTAVAGAVALAAVCTDPSRQPRRLRQFLESARGIASSSTGRLPPEAD
jgi:hypothetical protein